MRDSRIISVFSLFGNTHANQFLLARSLCTIDQKEKFLCANCGPRPTALVIDGIAVGLQMSVLDRYEDNVDEAAVKFRALNLVTECLSSWQCFIKTTKILVDFCFRPVRKSDHFEAEVWSEF